MLVLEQRTWYCVSHLQQENWPEPPEEVQLLEAALASAASVSAAD